MPLRLLTIFIFIYTTGSAQLYPFVHYTPKDGLINSRVRKAYQDSKGRMYFITYGGLSVYDGARFRNYTTQNGLASDLVNDVFEAGEDSLLVAVNTTALNVLVRGKMKPLTLPGSKFPIINHLIGGNNGVTFASTDDGLYSISKKGVAKLNAAYPSPLDSLLFLGEIVRNKDMLVFTLNDLRQHTGLFLYSIRENKIIDALPRVLVRSISCDRKGQVWISTNSQIHTLDSSAMQQGRLYLTQPSRTPQMNALSPGVMSFSLNNDLLIATGEKGIVKCTETGHAVNIGTPDAFIAAVQAIFVDRENIVWLCHDGNGVYKLTNTQLQSTRAIEHDNESGINAVRSFGAKAYWLQMNDGTWIMSSGSHHQSYKPTPRGLYLVQYNRKHIYAVERNRLYMASWPSTPGNRVIQFKNIMVLPDTSGFGTESVNDPYGNVIMHENRNILVMQDSRRISSYPLSIYDLVQGMYIDRRNQLWVISRGNGLVVFSLHPENPTRYLQKVSQYINEFGVASPRCMVVDKNETLWVGTRYHGIMGFQFKGDKLAKEFHFQSAQGLTDNFVTSLACDELNNIIIGTQTGLDRLVKEGNRYRLENITRSNNLFSYINHVWTDANNNAYAFTNAQKVLRLAPVEPIQTVHTPKLLIEEFKVNGQPVDQIGSAPVLKYYQKNINVSVAAPTYIDENHVRYSYLLEGTGNDRWSDTLPVADFSLVNLAPADYTLHVKAFFPSTVYQPQFITFPFSIQPPWWQTWWFKLSMAIVLAAVFVSLIRIYYLRKLRKQRTALERKQAIEKERTRIATDMHDDLGAGLSRIKFLSETIGIKQQQRQPIQEDISKIREYSHEMIDKMGEIVWALNEKNDSLSDLLSYTRSYAAEYLSQNGIECVVEVPEDPPSPFVSGEFRRHVFLSVKEILHNTVKHAQASKVVITIRVGHELVIRISDDGMGFDEKNIRPFSNGLSNIRKRMTDMGGRMSISNNPGTTIELVVPLP